MNTCETCIHWTRQPDKVWSMDRGVKPRVIRHGVCSELDISVDDPSYEDMIARNPSLCSDYGDTVTTGILFGCVHHKPRD